MFLLRRSVARAAVVASSPSKSIFSKTRSVSTYGNFQLQQQQQQRLRVFGIQRRFASDEVTRGQDDFSQTAAEAPVDEDVRPVEEMGAQEGAARILPVEEEFAQEATTATSGADALMANASRSVRDKAAIPPTKNVYVGNLFYEVTEDQLKRVFSRFGPLVSHNLVKDNRGLSRGFGYVEFENVADATAAVESLDMQVFEGRNLVVQYLRPRRAVQTRPQFTQKNSPSKTLFIGNMSFEMTDKDLNDLFRDVRNVLDVRVAVDRRTGQPRGFAHADFLDVASATKAKEVLDGKVILGRPLRLDYTSSSGTRKDRRPALSEEEKDE